jgi:hypothetical protein
VGICCRCRLLLIFWHLFLVFLRLGSGGGEGRGGKETWWSCFSGLGRGGRGGDEGCWATDSAGRGRAHHRMGVRELGGTSDKLHLKNEWKKMKGPPSHLAKTPGTPTLASTPPKCTP